MKKILVLIILLFISDNPANAFLWNYQKNLTRLKHKISKRKQREDIFTLIPDEINCRYFDLGKEDLRYLSLNKIDFTGTNFFKTKLQHSIISGCNFRETILEQTDFSHVTFWAISNL